MTTIDMTMSSKAMPIVTLSHRQRSYSRRSVPQSHQRRQPRNLPVTLEEKPSCDDQTLGNYVSQIDPFRFPTTVDTVWIIQTAISTLIDHFLFVRGLFPVPVMELQKGKTTSNEVVAKSSISSRRKIQQAKRQLETFADSWTSESSSELIRQASLVLITLGPSPSRGQEFYLLDVRNLRFRPTMCLKPPPPAGALARRLLPRIMESNWDLPSSHASSLKLFVSVWLHKDKMEEYWQNHSSQVLQTGTLQTTSRGDWIPRSGRLLPKLDDVLSPSVRRKRKKQLMLIPLVQQVDASPQNDSQACDTFNELPKILDLDGTTREGQWLCCSHSIKGFRI